MKKIVLTALLLTAGIAVMAQTTISYVKVRAHPGVMPMERMICKRPLMLFQLQEAEKYGWQRVHIHLRRILVPPTRKMLHLL